MIRYLTLAAIIFRFEVGILLVLIIITEYAHNNLSIGNTLKQMIVTSIISLIISVPLDSFFWNQWIWPEGMVFYFNAILNKSSEWGTLPFYAYFTSFLPRLLLISFPLALFGYLNDIRVRRILTPIFVYVTIFSCLPHKEWRFIVYTIPVFTCAAAYSVTWFITNASRSLFYRLCSLLILIGSILSFMISITLFQISRHNYPGGEALYTLHQIERNSKNLNVHIDSETAMTGASLYGQLYYPDWSYSKNESHHSEQDFIDAHYTHLITATPNKFDTSSLFEIIDETYGLDKVQLKTPKQYFESIKSFDFSPISIQLSPKLYTLKLVNPQKTWIQSTLRKYPVVLYSKTYCPYCKAAKQIIKKYCPSIQTIEVDLEKDGSNIQRALYELTGQYTFPNLFKSGKSLGGYDNLSDLDRKGQLNDLC
ncbi:Alg9-like mannosyltransferase family-domain-containing protein [Pilaira anomala]|nr:Alg9-like mannosyltransferase family-domain-containing protein [Pilaira anomala]